MVNREPGAALRVLPDDYLNRLRIPPDAISGYRHEVKNHQQGAQLVAYGLADAGLGLRAVANAGGLEFVPLKAVRFDLNNKII
jgi:putative molybdopterin biosynthesis protein